MASLCREFGISRKTGYKVLERYEECGWEGLPDLSRAPTRFLALGPYNRVRDYGPFLSQPLSSSSPMTNACDITTWQKKFGNSARFLAFCALA